MTAENIKSGFRKTGICPFNVEAVDFTKCLRLPKHKTEKTILVEKSFATQRKLKCGLEILEEFLEPGQLKEFRKEGEIKEEDNGLFKVWSAIKAKLLNVTRVLNDEREQESAQDVVQDLLPDREQVPVEEVDHDLVPESGPDYVMDVDRDQLGIFNYDSVGQYGYPIGPIVEAAIEDDEDSPMEDDDEEDVDEVETNSDPFWMKTCVICSLTLCVCPTPAEVEAESEAAAAAAAAAASILEDTDEIVDCPAEKEAESEAEAVATIEKDTDEVVEYIINKLCNDATKVKIPIEVRDSPARLPKEMAGLLSSPYVSPTVEKSLWWKKEELRNPEKK